MTAEQWINRIKTYDARLQDAAVNITKQQVYAGRTKRRTGHLQWSIHAKPTGAHSFYVTSNLDYAKYICGGRRAINMPQDAVGPHSGPPSAWRLHWFGDGGEVFAKRSSEAPPDNFFERAARIVKSMAKKIF